MGHLTAKTAKIRLWDLKRRMLLALVVSNTKSVVTHISVLNEPHRKFVHVTRNLDSTALCDSSGTCRGVVLVASEKERNGQLVCIYMQCAPTERQLLSRLRFTSDMACSGSGEAASQRNAAATHNMLIDGPDVTAGVQLHETHTQLVSIPLSSALAFSTCTISHS